MAEQEQEKPKTAADIDPRRWNDRKIIKEGFDCYGTSFEEDDEQCMGTCMLRDRCVVILARKIPTIEQQAGRALDNSEVAEALGAETAETIQLGRKLLPFMDRNKGGHYTGKWKEGTDGNPVEKFLPVQAGPSPDLVKALAALGTAAQAETPPPGAASVSGLELVLGGKKDPVAADGGLVITDDDVAAAEKVAKKKAPAKKAPPKKKDAKKAAPEKKPAPKKPAPKKKAAVKKKAAPKKAAPKKAAPKKKPNLGDKMQHVKTVPMKKKPAVKKAGGPTASRFDRERARSPKVAALQPGTCLEREYNGKTWKVYVKADHYTMNGKKYETLYSTVVAIAGASEFEREGGSTRKMANWSSPKFWKLK